MPPPCAGGDGITVTEGNLTLYQMLVADFRLNREIAGNCRAFLDGLSVLIEQPWLRMFNARELQQLISGASKGLDIADLQQHVVFGGGYGEDHPVIVMFWRVLSSFDAAHQSAFLKFVTGCSKYGATPSCCGFTVATAYSCSTSALPIPPHAAHCVIALALLTRLLAYRPPLLGFAHLRPMLAINMRGHVGNEASEQALPTASTCFNLLKLPPFTSEEVMRDKLMLAFEAGTGFDLS